jgi:uncharacterized membrane protein
MNKSKIITWLLIIGYFGWTLIDNFFHPLSIPVASALITLFLVCIATVHGLHHYSMKQYIMFFVITFIVSNIYENMSILTGFPFGHYHYTELLGPKLFLVPLLVAPGYFGGGYLSWSLAHILLGVYGSKLRSAQIFAVPVIAAFLMVMWDMQNDPIVATIGKYWIWHDGGSYFGVPFVNFMGWLLCVYTFFQIYAIYISRKNAVSEREEKSDTTDRSYWYQIIAAWVVLSLPRVIVALVGQNVTVTDAAGIHWQTMHIYESVALVTIFTMWFVALLCFLLTGKRRL